MNIDSHQAILHRGVPFEYQGWTFLCSSRRDGPWSYRAAVFCHAPSPSGAEVELPPDTEPYGSEAEALRHAEEQAVTWVHERTGTGQGLF